MGLECTILTVMTPQDLEKARDSMIAAANAIGDNDRGAKNAYLDCASRVNRLCASASSPPKRRPEPRVPEVSQPYLGEPQSESVVDKIRGVFSDD